MSHGRLPMKFAGLTVDGDDLKTHIARRVGIVVRAGRLTWRLELFAKGFGGDHVNLVTPNYW